MYSAFFTIIFAFFSHFHHWNFPDRNQRLEVDYAGRELGWATSPKRTLDPLQGCVHEYARITPKKMCKFSRSVQTDMSAGSINKADRRTGWVILGYM